MSKSVFIGIALVAMLGSACNRDNYANRDNRPAEGGGLSGAANPEVRLTAPEQEFVQKASKGNEMEVDLAEMAQDKSQSDAVKQYADQLERDHKSALEDLKRIADRADLKLDEQPPAEKASLENRLAAAKGPQFDHEFLTAMIDDHNKDIAEFERMRTDATGELKAFLDKTLPVMREHLQKAEALMAEMKK